MKLFSRYYMLMGAVAFAASLTSCNDENENAGGAPTVDLEALEFTATPGEGEIVLSWNLPDPSQCDYIRLEWYDPREKKDNVQLLSNYPDKDTPESEKGKRSYVIENTRARYGANYNFKFIAYKGNTSGDVLELNGISSLPAPSYTKNERIKIHLTKDNLYTNSPEFNGKKLEYICDGIHDDANKGLLFHTNNTGEEPYYVDIDFGRELTRFEIYTWNSFNHTSTQTGIPKHAKVFLVNGLGDTGVDVTSASPIFEYDYENKGKGEENSYTYPSKENEELSEGVQYIRYEAQSDSPSSPYTYWNLSELEIYEIIYQHTDPEVDEIPIYDQTEENKE